MEAKQFNINGTTVLLKDESARNRIAAVEGKLPSDASSSNKLITKTVDDLLYYYLKSETYTKSEVEALIGAIQHFHYEVYASTSAVTNPASNVLYLIGPTGGGADKYEEYVYSNNTWVKIGDTSIDLSGYVTTEALNTALAAYTTTANLTTLLAGKQDVIADLATIRSNATSAYQKPSGGIPKSDLEQGVKDSLELADTALQSSPVGQVSPSVDPYEYATRAELEELGQELDKNYATGGYLKSDGSVVSESDWGYSDYIPYTSGNDVIWRWNSSFASVTGPAIIFYNSNKVKVDYWGASSASASVGGRKLASSSIPATAAFIRCSFKLSDKADCYLYIGSTRAWSPIESTFDRLLAAENNIGTLSEKTIGLVRKEQTLTWTNGKLIQYENGGIVDTAATFQVATIPTSGIVSVYAFVCGGGAASASIAFYSEETPSVSSYIQEGSVEAIDTRYTPGPGSWVSAPVPAGAKSCAVCNRYGSTEGVNSPIVRTVSLLTLEAVDESFADVYTQLGKKRELAQAPFWNKHFYAHFNPIGFTRDGYGNKVIPGESLADIRLAKRLGFDWIEANVHTTSDGKQVVLHGESGNFGQQFIDLNGGDTSTMVIAETSLDYIKNYIRYDSDIAKFQTAPPTLEEFVQCCLDNDLGLFLGTNREDSIKMCIGKMADRLIVYGPPANIRNYWKGYILFWHNRSDDTADSLLTEMRRFGPPAICGMGDTTIAALKARDEYETLIETMHSEGYFFGTAAVYSSETTIQEAIRLGADLIGSGHQVNDFTPNLFVADIDGDTSNITLGNATISNKVISMGSSDTIEIGPSERLAVGKCHLSIVFVGTLSINFGSVGNRANLVSDGTSEVVISDFLFDRVGKVTITASAPTTISHLVYKVSRC